MGCWLSMSVLICAHGGDLVLGCGELEGVLELALPVAVGGERESFGNAALRIEIEKLVRHVAHRALTRDLVLRPGGAAQPVEGGLRFTGAAKFLYQVERVNGT